MERIRVRLVVVFIIVAGCAAATDVATLTKNPVSVTALVGTIAHFHCAGTGELLVWIVDGSLHYYQNVVVRGISAHVVPFPSSLESTLTVPATPENNGLTVQCIIQSTLLRSYSRCCTLTVLPGIGRVLNLRFNPSFSQVLWDPPLTAGELSNVYYQVTVTSNGSNEANEFKKTLNTYYNFPEAKRCQNYTASVTAFSSQYHGPAVTITQRTPGGYYELQRIAQVNFVVLNGSVIFTFNLELMDTVLPCRDQVLRIQTFPQSNASDVTSHPDFLIVGSGNVVYPITAGIHRKDLYTATVSVVGHEGVIDVLHLNFSTYHIQHCNVHPDHTSYILVECTFAINSTAPGFVLIQDEHSQYTINTTLQRHEGDVSKGSVLIPDVPAGEYSVTVYDEMPSIHKKPAYMYVHRHKISSTLSTPSTDLCFAADSNLYDVFRNSKVVELAFTIVMMIVAIIVWMKYSCIFGTAMPVPTNGTLRLDPVDRREPEITNLFQQHQNILAALPAAQPAAQSAPLPNSPPPSRSTTDIQQSTNPPAAPPPTQPVVYTDTQQSTNPPAAPPPTQPVVSTETITTGQDNHNVVNVSVHVQFPSPTQPADYRLTHPDQVQPNNHVLHSNNHSSTSVVENQIRNPTSVVEDRISNPTSVVEDRIPNPISVVEDQISNPTSVVNDRIPNPTSVVNDQIPNSTSVMEDRIPTCNPTSVVEDHPNSARLINCSNGQMYFYTLTDHRPGGHKD